jgi:hypothetical protein
MKQAYMLAKGDNFETSVSRDAEQRAAAKLSKAVNKKVVKPTTPASTGKKTTLDAATVAAAKRVGMDPNEYAAFANISDLDSYERMKKSKKG